MCEHEEWTLKDTDMAHHVLSRLVHIDMSFYLSPFIHPYENHFVQFPYESSANILGTFFFLPIVDSFQILFFFCDIIVQNFGAKCNFS